MFKNDGLKNIEPRNKHGHIQDTNHGIHMKTAQMAVLIGCPDECSISIQEGQHAQGPCAGHTRALRTANEPNEPNTVDTNFSLPLFLPGFPGLQSLPQGDPGQDGC